MIRTEFRDLDKLRDRFGSKIVTQALNSVVNKTANKARTFVSKTVRDTYNVKAAKIKQSLHEIRRKDPKDLVAERILQYTGGKVSLVNFGARPARISGSKRKGASVLVRKDRGRKIVKGKSGFGAFIAPGANSNVHVFIRKTTERQPIEKLSGPSIAEMIATTETQKKVDAFVQAEMPKELDHALDYFLTKAGAR